MYLPDFSHPPGAIAIDLDGTLLNSSGELSERNRASITACAARGIPVIIATSRPARIFDRIFPRDLAGVCSLVVLNGAVAIGNSPLSGYFKEPFPERIARDIIILASEFDPDIRIILELDGHEFGSNWPSVDADTLWQRNAATPDMVLSIEEALSRQPCKMALDAGRTDILKLADKLNLCLGESISVIPALIGKPMLNITTPRASKTSALRKLLAPLGIPLQEVLALGDDIPDIGMLRQCGIPVAMGNSFPEVKAICPYQTTSNDEDGVAYVLERILSAFES